ASAELYDPKTGRFGSTGSLSVARMLHTATLLPDGRVLVVGGYDSDDFTGTGEAVGTGKPGPAITPGKPDPRRIAELYNPATDTFSRTGSMSVDRYGHTATLLEDGRVLVVGGSSLISGISASAELYDPKTGVFSATGSMSAARTGHTATLLSNGKVLIAGGYSLSGLSLASAELYDPNTGKFRLTGPMSIGRVDHTAATLRDGRVLVAGGFDVGGNSHGDYSSAELYDPDSGAFAATGVLLVPRSGLTATLLGNGRVLLTISAFAANGGTGKVPAIAELYSPTTGSFSPIEGMDEPYDTATGLSDGSVLMTGGSVNVVGGAEALSTAELYRP
ncbi:MAG TPA: kelch repeat-containing protein, partial [Candidatus Limnocylindrales bacterium]